MTSFVVGSILTALYLGIIYSAFLINPCLGVLLVAYMLFS